MRIIIPFLMLSFASMRAPLLAQYIPQHTQYMMNNYLINPAVAGIENYTDVKLASRIQWAEVAGRPESAYLTAFAPIFTDGRPALRNGSSSWNKRQLELPSHHGVGIKVMADRSGAYRRLYASVSYAYHVRLSDRLAMSLGIAGGGVQHSLDRSEIDIQNTADPILTANDVNSSHFDLSAGWWLYNRDFYIGFSGLQLLDAESQFLNLETSRERITPGNYFLTAGYRFFTDDQHTVTPSLLLKKAAGESWTLDANVKAQLYQRIWGGIGTRNFESFLFFAGLALSPLLEVSYSYDQGVTGINRYGVSSHEIMVGFKLDNQNRVYCPRMAW